MAAPQAELTGPFIGSAAPAAVRTRWRVRLRQLEIIIPAAVLILLIAACFLGPLVFSLPSPVGANPADANLPLFSPGHLLGTDTIGNDILSRILYGGRTSIEISFAVISVGTLIGGMIGALAGISSGILDSVIMRVIDMLLAFPSLVLVLVLANALKPSELNVIWALSFFSVPAVARISRAAALRIREQDYMLAARFSGTRRWRMLTRHLAPNMLPQLATFALLGAGLVVLLEATLAYLGFSVPPPQPTWGDMIYVGQNYLSSNPSLVLIPSIALFIYVISLNLLSDGLRARWGTV